MPWIYRLYVLTARKRNVKLVKCVLLTGNAAVEAGFNFHPSICDLLLLRRGACVFASRAATAKIARLGIE